MGRARGRSMSSGSQLEAVSVDSKRLQAAADLLEFCVTTNSPSLLHNPSSLFTAHKLLERIHELDEAKAGGTKSPLLPRSLSLPEPESAYTPLHAAVVRGDLATLLLLLRYTTGCQRWTDRPMQLLQNISWLDAEGLTPAALLSELQRSELRACREKVLYNPTVAEVQTSAVSRIRRGSFDVPNDEQDEFSELRSGLGFINREETEKKIDSEYACEVLTFGRAHHCALGVGVSQGNSQDSSKDKVRPQRVHAFAQEAVGRSGGAVAVSGAAHHTLVVTAAGHLYAFGLGKGGRLGLGDESHCAHPTRVMGSLSSRRVVSAAAAENHSLCVTSCGQVFAWGSNRFGQLGIPNADDSGSNRYLPRRVDDLKSVFCVSVACGEKHSLALSKRGEVYVWGDNTAGQLGISRRNGVHRVQRVDSLWSSSTPKRAIAIAASEQATLVLTLPTKSGLRVNNVYGWGQGNHVPIRIQFEQTKETHNRMINPVAIACARYHNAAITSDGFVFTWGLHAESLGTSKNASSPHMLSAPQLVTGMLSENGGGRAVAISASENHTAVVTDNGDLFTWGATYGQNILGHEGVSWQPAPKRVPGVQRAVGVAAAKEHTVLLIATSFPKVSQGEGCSTLELLAARTAAKHIDLFNVLQILVTAWRTHSHWLIDYCNEFVRLNLDGVLNVAQRSVLDCFLNEQLSDGLLDDCYDRDLWYHPLVTDVLKAGLPSKCSLNRRATAPFEDWLRACKHLANHPTSRQLIAKMKNVPVTSSRLRNKSRGLCFVSQHQEEGENVEGTRDNCSDRCLALTTNMDLSSKSLAEERFACLTKEVRGVKKKLCQITKLETDTTDKAALTVEQKEKIARKLQLEADLLVFEPALDAIKVRLRDFLLVDEKECEKITEETSRDEAGHDPHALPTTSLRCEICNILCPDAKSHELHLSGRKHRNQVARFSEKEKEQAAASVMAEQARRQFLIPEDAIEKPIASSMNPWQNKTSLSLPKYNLPPPPHPLPLDGMVRPSPSPAKSLRAIMEEETKQSKKKTAKRSQATLKSPPISSPPLKSPPWANATAQVHVLAPSPIPLTSITPVKKSLGDFMDQSKPERSALQSTAGWASPGLTTGSALVPAVSLLEIQEQEVSFKKKQDQSFSSNGKWFIERRERAGSFKEIQSIAKKEKEEQLLIEEQIWIEKQIQQEIAAKKAAETHKSKKEGKKKQSHSNQNGKDKSKGTKKLTHRKARQCRTDAAVAVVATSP